MAAETRLVILKAFQTNGLLLDKDALSTLCEYLASAADPQQAIADLIESCHSGEILGDLPISNYALDYITECTAHECKNACQV